MPRLDMPAIAVAVANDCRRCSAGSQRESAGGSQDRVNQLHKHFSSMGIIKFETLPKPNGFHLKRRHKRGLYGRRALSTPLNVVRAEAGTQ